MLFTPCLSLLLFVTFSSAEPDAQPEAEPQQFTNNAPFSGAIYIVNPNGQEITTYSNQCPSYAAQNCGSIGKTSWCCPGGYTCAAPQNANGMCGCCPVGSSCGGTINVASITTVTVQAAQQTVYVHPEPTTVAVYGKPEPSRVVYQGGFCSTLTMDGPGLPTTREAECGTILIVNQALPNLRPLGFGIGAVTILLHMAIWRIFF
ncbi:hypothetical protein B0J11DRAFT_176458 [Dendryphion nanum]|uniref:Uncharacterized protein n=1 Tax=Dendryphion nanum TaxID=256645 RepID=A0A9P9EB29_9PLEO|nr:hypothetical protein B0J11DRAFT_176458 [Dendryphion nanum]